MKIIFLDIDGVLNGSMWIGPGQPTISAVCVANLNYILKETKAKLVISSTWRDQILNGKMTIAGFAYLLRSHGIDCEIEGITPSDGQVNGRPNQIAYWLDQNKGRVTEFVILDDQNYGFNTTAFVQTDPKLGLTQKDADRVILKLGRAGHKPSGLIIP